MKSSSQESMQIVGQSDVIMEGVLEDGSVSSFRVRDDLHFPKLGKLQITWRKWRTKGCSEFGEGDVILINNETNVMFEAVFDGNLFQFPDIPHSGQITYHFRHQALGHLVPSSLNKPLKLYSDADTPVKPNDFICSSCDKCKMIGGPKLSISQKYRI